MQTLNWDPATGRLKNIYTCDAADLRLGHGSHMMGTLTMWPPRVAAPSATHGIWLWKAATRSSTCDEAMRVRGPHLPFRGC